MKRNRFNLVCIILSMILLGANIAAVSYTHLDVYKRQLYVNCKAPGGYTVGPDGSWTGETD